MKLLFLWVSAAQYQRPVQKRIRPFYRKELQILDFQLIVFLWPKEKIEG
jgi:hypothetical protein